METYIITLSYSIGHISKEESIRIKAKGIESAKTSAINSIMKKNSGIRPIITYIKTV